MTGLEGILARIEQDARNQAEVLLEAAKEKSQQELQEAREEAQRQSQAILAEAQQKADAMEKRAEATALLEKRDALLRCKQQLIREAVSQVCADLENAPAEEYFSILLELAGRFAQPGKGAIRLNDRDLERLPKDFEKALKTAAPQGELTVSREPVDISGGCILGYGLIEIDCTFQGLFQESYDQLRDTVGTVLFPRP